MNAPEVNLCHYDVSEKNNNMQYLENIQYDNTVSFVPPIQYGKVIKVYDGDTFTVASKLVNNEFPIYRFSVRLRNVDAPEIRGGSLHEKELALESRDALHQLLFGRIVRLKNISTEKYGRILADVYIDELHVNKWLLANGYAVPYDGGTKHRPAEWD